MHKPWHSLLFGIVLFLVLALIAEFFPEEGIRVGNELSVNFPSLKSLTETPEPKKDITAILRAADSLDAESLMQEDTVFRIEGAPIKEPEIKKEVVIPVVQLQTGIQSADKHALDDFFSALSSLHHHPSEILRVLHYGDSQIEGDRITDYLRNKWQQQFGGSGPGLISPLPLTASPVNLVRTSQGWDRYNAFLARDKRVEHKNFGVMAGFTRFLPYRQITDTTQAAVAGLTITTNQKSVKAAKSYSRLRLFYGGAQRKTSCRYYDGPALMKADSLLAGGDLNIAEYPVTGNTLTHSFRFKGKDSPDIYGLSLDGVSGINVDNIAMRGSSGTFFHHISKDQLKKFYDLLNVKLVILQFGGNALPAIKDSAMAVNYASYLRGQIRIVKKIAPGASILFIGPSDMSLKVGTEYVTYPFLEFLRDEIKKVVLESGCAFYDLYDSMGGRNSMASWVDEKLAATDYIHFSPKGARKIATLLYAAIMNEYANYLKSSKDRETS